MSARQEQGVVTVELVGRLDGNSASEFGRLLAERLGETEEAPILDVRGLEFISSAGLRELLILAKRFARRKPRTALVGVTAPIDEVLELAGLNAFFLRADSVEDALRLRTEKSGGGFLTRLFSGASKP